MEPSGSAKAGAGPARWRMEADWGRPPARAEPDPHRPFVPTKWRRSACPRPPLYRHHLGADWWVDALTSATRLHPPCRCLIGRRCSARSAPLGRPARHSHAPLPPPPFRPVLRRSLVGAAIPGAAIGHHGSREGGAVGCCCRARRCRERGRAKAGVAILCGGGQGARASRGFGPSAQRLLRGLSRPQSVPTGLVRLSQPTAAIGQRSRGGPRAAG